MPFPALPILVREASRSPASRLDVNVSNAPYQELSDKLYMDSKNSRRLAASAGMCGVLI